MGSTKFRRGLLARRGSKIITKLPFITLVPCLVTIAAIVLINIGGVDSHDEGIENLSLNLPLLKWKYTVEPVDGIKSITEHLYLNRACIRWESDKEPVVELGLCYNIHDLSYDESTFSTTINTIDSMPRGPLNLKLTQGLYTGSAGLALILMILPAILAFTPQPCKKNFRFIAVFISILGFVVVLGASSFITHQMTALKSQILNFKPQITKILNEGTSSEQRLSYTNVEYVQLGYVVLGLTWVAAVAMLSVLVTWCLSFIPTQSVGLSKESDKLLGDDTTRG
ncbi:hypothetical protein GLAREA_07929 [Glarea lozoyensis ATCC 20868]|uniref:SUR7 family protein pun1 n=1 Tax=Glarea lozoyensis (strain ATCC 20868 / MF5171) TaxID=1116229 RepID=S3D4V4_GLAL2|nr:uncharacterized protein GLAREA_07929 [Glarea lozoyensis ATCC 20868]EPE32795.1 hypothetical protein GLAREA_07929 [Glarea lozoyensis ATCC 20868]